MKRRHKSIYPKAREKNRLLTQVITDAILAGYNSKEISAYFGKSCISFVTRRVNVKKLNIKRMLMKFEEKKLVN